MPDQKTVDICKKLIEKEIGHISNLPSELKNTVCNVYFHGLKNSDKQLEPDDFKSERTLLLSKMIKSFRKIRETEGKREVNFISRLIVDEMKYGIKDSHRYSEVSRFIKRLIRRKKVNEIEDLYKYFD